MKNSTTKINLTKMVILILAGVFFLSACSVPAQPTPDLDAAVDLAMQTLQAQFTQQAYETLVGQLTQAAQESPSPTVDNTVTALSQTPDQTQIHLTGTPPQPDATPTATPLPCNLISFVKDITVVDSAIMSPGEGFTKTWQLSNVGSCTWTTDYDLVFVEGTAMSVVTSFDLPFSVAPGESIELSVPMIAPTTAGEYTGHWMLRSNKGILFGLGKDALSSFWVRILVVAATGEVYNFTNKVCSAAWSSGSTNFLPCPGSGSDIATGYVKAVNEPIREDGAKENEIGLITRPNNAADGWISGVYPTFLVQNGDYFRTSLSCGYESPKCNVQFELKYRVGSGPVQSLFTRLERYEGKFQYVDVDLSPLAGKNVNFILEVRNGTSSSDNTALWIRPGIWR